MVRKLAKRGLNPSVIATSPLVRCRQTAEIIAECVDDCAAPVELTALEPGSDLGALLAWTAEQQAERVAWVGHAPDVDQLAGALIGRPEANLRFNKGAIAALDFESNEPLSAGLWELRWFVAPKQLGC
jgi:phosphohistidine phosphatase